MSELEEEDSNILRFNPMGPEQEDAFAMDLNSDPNFLFNDPGNTSSEPGEIAAHTQEPAADNNIPAPNNSGSHRFNIRINGVPRGGIAIRRQRGTGVVNNGSNNNPHIHHSQRYQVRLPALQAQPAPFQPQQINDLTTNPSQKNNKEFECAICFEFLQDPCGCGKCANRFCFRCLARVRQSNTNSSNALKCPCCRNTFTTIVKDKALEERMKVCLGAIPCTYPGCNVRKNIVDLQEHQKTCTFQPMKCKYSSFGCTYTGPKHSLEEHYKTTCHYEKVSGLVQQIRVTRAIHSKQINVLNHQFMHQTRRADQQMQMAIMRLKRSPWNLFHCLEFVYMGLCHPGDFFLDLNSLWYVFFHGGENAAVDGCFYILHLLYLVPSLFFTCRNVLYILKIFLHGQSDLVVTSTSDNSQYHQNSKNDSLQFILLQLFPSFLGFLALMCFYLFITSSNINQSASEGTQHRRHNSFIIFHHLTTTSFTIFYSCLFSFLKYYYSKVHFMYFMVLTYSMNVLPSYFQELMIFMWNQTNSPGNINNNIDATSILNPIEQQLPQYNVLQRTKCVVFFSIRYGLLLSLFGVRDFVTSIIYSRLILDSLLSKTLRDRIPKWVIGETEDDDHNIIHELTPKDVYTLLLLSISVFVSTFVAKNDASQDGFYQNMLIEYLNQIILHNVQVWIFFALMNFTIYAINRLTKDLARSVATYLSSNHNNNVLLRQYHFGHKMFFTWILFAVLIIL